MRRAALRALLPLALIAAAPGVARAAEELTPRKQALLFLRVLVYDRNLKARAGNELRVAVAYHANDPVSEQERTALVTAFEEVSQEVVAAGLPVRVVALPYHDAPDFESRLAAARPAALFACIHLVPIVKSVARSTRLHHVLSATGSREMTEAGLAIGLVGRGKRAAVLVNLPAARSEGADLDAALLAISEVMN